MKLFGFSVLILSLASSAAFARYNGVEFDTGYPSAVAGECKIQGMGSYYVEDDCLPNIEMTLYAYNSSNQEFSTNCGTYPKLQDNWQEGYGSNQACVVNVPASGTYRVEVGMVDGFGYQFYSDTVQVSVVCP